MRVASKPGKLHVEQWTRLSRDLDIQRKRGAPCTRVVGPWCHHKDAFGVTVDDTSAGLTGHEPDN